MAARNFFAWRMLSTATAQDERNHLASVCAEARILDNPLLHLPETEFKRNYCLLKKAFKVLCKELKTITYVKIYSTR